MITVNCDVCHSELRELGGLGFGPPEEDGRVRKLHFCRHCWHSIIVAATRLRGPRPQV